MPIAETERRLSRRSTGWRRALSNDLDRLVGSRKANTFCSKDDGLVPNHPHWNLIVHRGPVKLPEQFDPAAIFQDFTDATALGSSCLNGIYDYVHYRSHIPEVLGLARGSGKLQFGGRWGRTLSLEAGDIALRGRSGSFPRLRDHAGIKSMERVQPFTSGRSAGERRAR